VSTPPLFPSRTPPQFPTEFLTTTLSNGHLLPLGRLRDDVDKLHC
jgi:hypothetical protein